LRKKNRGILNQDFAKLVHLIVFRVLSELKKAHICSGQKMPQFGKKQLQFSIELPGCAFFAQIQVT
jgi:hypothetical protein